MNLRELLKTLQAVDEKHLDMDVMVSPASGGYAGISHVSVLYVGHAVIHLAEPKPVELPDLWAGSQEGAVATVHRLDVSHSDLGRPGARYFSTEPIGFFLIASMATSAINAKIIPVLRSTTSFFLLDFLPSGVCAVVGTSGTSMECISPGS